MVHTAGARPTYPTNVPQSHGFFSQIVILSSLSLPVTRICVNFSTVYNDTLVAKGLKLLFYIPWYSDVFDVDVAFYILAIVQFPF